MTQTTVTTTVPVTVDIDISGTQLADWWWELDNHQQAEFFARLTAIKEQAPLAFGMQIEFLREALERLFGTAEQTEDAAGLPAHVCTLEPVNAEMVERARGLMNHRFRDEIAAGEGLTPFPDLVRELFGECGVLHMRQRHPGWEYQVLECGRKEFRDWTDVEKEGWFSNFFSALDGRERGEYSEDWFWMRPKAEQP